MRNIFIILMLSLALLISCKHEPNSPIYSSKPQTSGLTSSITITYDSVGIWHNEYLDYVLNYYEDNGFTLDSAIEKGRLVELLFDYLYFEKGISAYELDTLFFPNNNVPNNTSVEQVAIDHNLSSLAKDYAASIDDNISDLEANNITLTTYIFNLENIISLADSLPTEKEKLALQAGASVAINSGTYWYGSSKMADWDLLDTVPIPTAFKQNKKLFYNNNFKHNGSFLEVSVAHQVLLADAAGAVSGGIDGAIIGFGGGPWGSLALGLFGAMTTGGVASAQTAILHRIYKKANI